MKPKEKIIAIIAGARPNFIKVAPLIRALETRGFGYRLIHTGQHYDFGMSQIFFDELNIPAPHVNLGIHSGTYPFTTQIAITKKQLEELFGHETPALVLVVGDCNSAVGGALAARTRGIPVGHIEAGLRSFDRTMSEESNRLVTDLLSDYLFTPSEDANQNLLREGHNPESIFLVGNIMIDTLVKWENEIAHRPILKGFGLEKETYGVFTFHRYNSVDTKPVLKEILEALDAMQEQVPFIVPLHPSTRKKIDDVFPGLIKDVSRRKNLFLIDPVGYLDMLHLLKNARFVFTDSGGIQEETTYLGVPCFTIRNNTERPVTVFQGTNTVVGTSKDSILEHFSKALDARSESSHQIPPYWDGKTAERIVDILLKILS